MEKKTNGLDKLFNIFKSEKNSKWILYIGFIGIAAILLSTFFSSNDSSEPAIHQTYQPSGKQVYTELLEERVAQIVSEITGSEATVMITLQSSTENIFAEELRQSDDITANQHGDATRTQLEQRFIIVNSPQGGQTALLVTELAPLVRGVVVVAKGADNPEVNRRITNAVMTALDITSRRVSVTSPIG